MSEANFYSNAPQIKKIKRKKLQGNKSFTRKIIQLNKFH